MKSNNNELLDSSVKEALKNVETPHFSASWDDMERLLDSNPKKYNTLFSDYSQHITVGAIGIVLLGGLLYMLFKNNSTELIEPEATEVLTSDTFKIVTPTAEPIKDSTKVEPQQILTQSGVDSIANANQTSINTDGKKEQVVIKTPIREEKNSGEDEISSPKKKKTIKDSTSRADDTIETISTDTSTVKKTNTNKKKKKKKSSGNSDSLKPSDPSQSINFLESIDNSNSSGSVKAVKDTAR